MTDTLKLQSAPQCVSGVAQVAAYLARSNREHRTHALEVTSYFPLDLETITRMLEGLADREDIEIREEDGLSYVHFLEPDAYNLRMLDMERGEHLTSNTSLLKHLSVLREDERWMRKVRDHHEVLRVAAKLRTKPLDLAYFVARTDLPSSKLQSLLHDMCAGGHIRQVVEDNDSAHYVFPEFEYPQARFTRNMELLTQLEPLSFRTMSLVIAAATVFALLLLLVLSR